MNKGKILGPRNTAALQEPQTSNDVKKKNVKVDKAKSKSAIKIKPKAKS